MDDKNMSIKQFLHRSGQVKSAMAFLAQYREYLTTGELAPIVSPILAKIDVHEIQPAPGIELIRNAVLAHHLAITIRQEETKQSRRETSNLFNKPNKKNYIATVFNAKGEVLKSKELPLDTDGIRWCDRRLIEAEPGSYGEVAHAVMTDKEGNPLVIYVSRLESMGRLLRKKKGPTVQKKSLGLTKPFVWFARAKQSKSNFSAG